MMVSLNKAGMGWWVYEVPQHKNRHWWDCSAHWASRWTSAWLKNIFPNVQHSPSNRIPVDILQKRCGPTISEGASPVYKGKDNMQMYPKGQPSQQLEWLKFTSLNTLTLAPFRLLLCTFSEWRLREIDRDVMPVVGDVMNHYTTVFSDFSGTKDLFWFICHCW